jgi:hypothetical protein
MKDIKKDEFMEWARENAESFRTFELSDSRLMVSVTVTFDKEGNPIVL